MRPSGMTQPTTGLAHAQHSTLIILDMQARATAALPQAEVAMVCEHIATTLRIAEVAEVPVICTEHCSPSLGPLDPRVAATLPGSTFHVRKHSYCAWDDDEFANAVEIAGRRQIVICGVQAHIGVLQTAVAMAGQGYAVFVAGDGTCSHHATLAANAARRLVANAVTVASCESLLYEWLAGIEEAARTRALALLQQT